VFTLIVFASGEALDIHQLTFLDEDFLKILAEALHHGLEMKVSTEHFAQNSEFGIFGPSMSGEYICTLDI
jgi:hypothetical protein